MDLTDFVHRWIATPRPLGVRDIAYTVFIERCRGPPNCKPMKRFNVRVPTEFTPLFAIVRCEDPKRRTRMSPDNSFGFLNGCHLPQRTVSILPTQIRRIPFWLAQLRGF